MLVAGKKETLEKLLTIAVFTGIFFPVRLLFYTFVSEYWIGSFGLMTGILLSLLYFSHKGKLGWLGRIVIKHVQRFSKGKFALGSIILSVFVLYFLGNSIYGMDHPVPEIKRTFEQNMEAQGVTDLKTFQEKVPERKLEGSAMLLAVVALILPTGAGHTAYAIINDWTDGWLLHFSTVWFVEQLEILGLVLYFRFRTKSF